MMVALILLLLVCIDKGSGYITGAPRSACESLRPGHGGTPGDLDSIPYEIKVVQLGRGKLEITLQGTGWLTKEEFKGFLVQVRRKADDAVIGTFTLDDTNYAKHAKCDPPQGTVTHRRSETKQSVQLLWDPPLEFQGQVEVVATVVKDFSTYWVNYRFTNVTIHLAQHEEDPDSNPEPETKSSPEPESDSSFLSQQSSDYSELEQEPEPEQEPDPESEPKTDPYIDSEDSDPEAESEPKKEQLGRRGHPVYYGCYSIKGCFGLPANCEANRSCDVLVTWKQMHNTTRLELYSVEGADRYAAVGLSQDAKMGEDLVFACTENNGVVELNASWNTGRGSAEGRGKASWPLEEFKGVSFSKGNIYEGRHLYCKFDVENILVGFPPFQNSYQFLFQLDIRKYHVLLTGGPYDSGQLRYHGRQSLASDIPINLQRSMRVEAATNTLVRLHGALMVVAWIGCAGTGILVARYYKETWRDVECCNQAQWFVWHRIFMVLTWLLTIVAILCIVVHVGGWTEPHPSGHLPFSNPHPILGLVALGLVFIQPFLALMRPHPRASYRWIFNWSHWLIGNSAFIVAMISIFFAVELEAAGLTREITWVLVFYVSWYVLTHLVLSINTCWAENNPPPRSQVYPIAGEASSVGYIEEVYQPKEALRGSGCRIFCIAFYFIIVLGVVVCIVLSILFTPINIFHQIGIK